MTGQGFPEKLHVKLFLTTGRGCVLNKSYKAGLITTPKFTTNICSIWMLFNVYGLLRQILTKLSHPCKGIIVFVN